jgi:hypothetical protein
MTQKHEALKQVAKQILKDKGFKEEEIKEEYLLYGGINGALHSGSFEKFKDVKDTHFEVDVVGINSKNSIAIECGTCPAEKIAVLKFFFNEVILLPFFTISESDKIKIIELEKTIIAQKQQIALYNQRNTQCSNCSEKFRNYDSKVIELMQRLSNLLFCQGITQQKLSDRKHEIENMVSILDSMKSDLNEIQNYKTIATYTFDK